MARLKKAGKAKRAPAGKAKSVKAKKRASKQKPIAKARKAKPMTAKKAVANADDICCKDIDLSKWKLKQVKWKRKPFYIAKYMTFFHIPIGFGGTLIKGLEVAKKKYHTPEPEMLLCKDTGLFSGKMMFPVKQASSSDPDIEELSGTYVTRGFQGPYGQMGNFIRVFTEQVRQRYGKKPSELLFWYANCPKCAKKQGGPKIVIFGRV